MGRLDGKVAIVTGAGGGIGRAHALLLAGEGASVVVNDLGVRSGASAEKVVAEIVEHGGSAITNEQSATWDGAADIVEAALESFGRVDIVINNATAGANNDIWRFTESDWDRSLNVNLKGYFAMVRSAPVSVANDRVWSSTEFGSGFGHPSMSHGAGERGRHRADADSRGELGRLGVRCNAIRPARGRQSTEDYAVKTARWISSDGLHGTSWATSSARTSTRCAQAEQAARRLACTDAAQNVNGRIPRRR
jgi:NAD(P)-dependent dehydrogenase (short-subunit alcohol dehydrogenase family)